MDYSRILKGAPMGNQNAAGPHHMSQSHSAVEGEAFQSRKYREAAHAVMSNWIGSERYPLPSPEQAKVVLDYVAAGKGVSMNTMFDKFEGFLSAGQVNSLVNAYKEARSSMAPSKPQTQAGRIDSYLKQNFIGLIKR